MRTLPVALTASLALLLTGCSGSSTPEPTPSPSETQTADLDCVEPGAATEQVQVSGGFGTAPSVTAPADLTAEGTEATLTVEGSGPVSEVGDTVWTNLTVYNATTQTPIEQSSYAPGGLVSFPIDPAQVLTGIVETLNCVPQGSQVVGVVPPTQGFGTTGSEQLGVGADDTIVIVADLVWVQPDRANGADQEPQAGFPEVELAEDGTPTLTIPEGATPPTTTSTEVLKRGDGPTVTDQSTVSVHYTGVNWTTGEAFDSSWERGEPSSFQVQGVVAGFRDGLVGQTAGSQVVIIVPPDQGYGEAGNEQAGIAGTDTIVFVVDILGTT
ncbi:FKBP-type peptidyl-prolyl cis-trans isomerase [Herbiconiux sp. SYSU D00978]|uniref:FKBP-type peptidyl-prolyl cis-trans isomerase n=1 Tax=Herbiconiux sp. SYSU D00978 TaxID=2812562 RepID=UPI001A97A8FF|nr:FKBP-type peptidyl-prolyl cis-trans isomerase [Herbiconiux sp. SYSU D00978]